MDPEEDTVIPCNRRDRKEKQGTRELTKNQVRVRGQDERAGPVIRWQPAGGDGEDVAEAPVMSPTVRRRRHKLQRSSQ